MRSAWQKFKEKTYKKYAVDPETAQVRLVSVAPHDGLNETIDATAVNVMPLLKVLKKKILVTHNGSFDLDVLRERYGYVHEGKVMDTEIMYLLHHYAEDGKRTKVEGGKRRLPDPTVTNVKVGDETVKMNSLLHVANKYLHVSLDKENQSADWSIPSLPQRMVDYSLED